MGGEGNGVRTKQERLVSWVLQKGLRARNRGGRGKIGSGKWVLGFGGVGFGGKGDGESFSIPKREESETLLNDGAESEKDREYELPAQRERGKDSWKGLNCSN